VLLLLLLDVAQPLAQLGRQLPLRQALGEQILQVCMCMCMCMSCVHVCIWSCG